MRLVSFLRPFIVHPTGSCLACFGATQVICTATLEDGQPPFLRETDQGWVTAEYAMLPASTSGGRKRREIGQRDGRSTEIQRLIGRSLRAAVDLESLGPITITLDCDVLQADGGTRTAAISGAWVALYDALRVLACNNGRSEGPACYLRGQVAAVSVGLVEGLVCCDLDYQQDKRADVDMNVVMRDGDLVEVQGTGERDIFSRRQLDGLLDAAESGIRIIQEAQLRALELEGSV